MHFFSFFKTLVGKQVTIELKNDLRLKGDLHSVDQFLNIKLDNVEVVDQEQFPHMMSVKKIFIRGSVVRYIELRKADVDTQLLQDASRRAARPEAD